MNAAPADVSTLTPETPAHVILLVAGESAATRSARANLEALLGDDIGDAERVRVIDVLRHPDYALRYRAFFTPTLIIETASGTTSIVGDLSELAEARRLLASAAV